MQIVDYLLEHNVLGEEPIVVLDVGARAAQLERWKQLGKNLFYYGFEPDTEECSRLNKSASLTSHPWKEQYVPIALGKDGESRRFYVTDRAACSSLLEPNLERLDDFSVKDPMSVVNITTIETVGLSQWADSEGIESVDFIKLDIQGAELEVLKSGENLACSALGIEIEVEFIELYKGQPMFCDVDTWIRSRGFLLFDISRVYSKRLSACEVIDTKGQLTWGDALYLRDSRSLFAVGEVKSPDFRARQVIKLALVASLYNRPDYSLYVLNSALNRSDYLAGYYSELINEVILDVTSYSQEPRNWVSRVFGRWYKSRFRSLMSVVFPNVFERLAASALAREKGYRWKISGW
jgi:FkbM family methyltransferase